MRPKPHFLALLSILLLPTAAQSYDWEFPQKWENIRELIYAPDDYSLVESKYGAEISTSFSTHHKLAPNKRSPHGVARLKITKTFDYKMFLDICLDTAKDPLVSSYSAKDWESLEGQIDRRGDYYEALFSVRSEEQKIAITQDRDQGEPVILIYVFSVSDQAHTEELKEKLRNKAHLTARAFIFRSMALRGRQAQ